MPISRPLSNSRVRARYDIEEQVFVEASRRKGEVDSLQSVIFYRAIWSLVAGSRLFHQFVYARGDPRKLKFLRRTCAGGLHFTSFPNSRTRVAATRRAVSRLEIRWTITRFQSASAVILRLSARYLGNIGSWGGNRGGTHHGLIFFRPVGKDLLKFLCVYSFGISLSHGLQPLESVWWKLPSFIRFCFYVAPLL